jgi:pilus assembly protein CpaB
MASRRSTPRPAAFASPPGGDEPSPLAAGLRSVAVVAGRHRRVLAAVCAGAAVVVTVSALTPASAPSSPTDGGRAAGSALLPAGTGDQPAEDADRVAVTVRLADPAGLLLVRAGSHAEVLAGPAADAGGVPVAAGTGSASGEVLASDAVVLAVPRPPGTGSASTSEAGVSGLLASSGGGLSGLDGVVVLAVPPPDARRIAAAAGTRTLSVAVALAPGWPR